MAMSALSDNSKYFSKADVWLKKIKSSFDNDFVFFLTNMILFKAKLISVPTRHELKYTSTTYD
jgi:hypothetical protein